MAGSSPSVALVVPTRTGVEYLPTLLDSVIALEYPRELIETIVVDNDSSDGSRELLLRDYAWATVLAQSRNLGFAEAVNVAARSTSADCLALANDDMRLDPGWLQALVSTYDPEGGVPCVGGVILDWEGAHTQFVDGIVNLHGAGAQVGFGRPLGEVEIVEGRRLPFACGGSMLISRELFLNLGGFDERYFAYFEDVDFGWRLQLAGYDIRLAAASRCFHRHHSTGSSIPHAERLRLYEGNWLRSVLKNAGDASVSRLLTAALLLLLERARLTDGAEAKARLEAAVDVVADLERILEQRLAVQALRRRSDDEVFATFGRPFFPALDQLSYADTVARVARLLQLEDLVPSAHASPAKEVEMLRAAHARSPARRLAGALRRRAHL